MITVKTAGHLLVKCHFCHEIVHKDECNIVYTESQEEAHLCVTCVEKYAEEYYETYFDKT